MKTGLLNPETLSKHPLPPIVNGDKETKGRILVIAGSREVPGAALLCATAAMRAGAGKLRIATAASAAVQIGIAMPEAMVVGLAEDDAGIFTVSALKEVEREASKVDAIVAGPGMAPGESSPMIAASLLSSNAALALDAALLHAMRVPRQTRHSPAILLPHAGELASLLDCTEKEIDTDPVGCGRTAADRYRSIVLVKGVTSHVVTPEGQSWTYRGGAPGLGVSGSGDVLAGIVGGLLARGAEPLNALLWAVWLHGEAGAVLAKRVAPIGFLARQIADEVPRLMPH